MWPRTFLFCREICVAVFDAKTVVLQHSCLDCCSFVCAIHGFVPYARELRIPPSLLAIPRPCDRAGVRMTTKRKPCYAFVPAHGKGQKRDLVTEEEKKKAKKKLAILPVVC